MDWEKTRKRRKMQFFKFSRIGWKKIKGREHEARLCIDLKKKKTHRKKLTFPSLTFKVLFQKETSFKNLLRTQLEFSLQSLKVKISEFCFLLPHLVHQYVYQG